jgi:hypothetical protein
MPDRPPTRPAQVVERHYPTGVVVYGIRIMFPGRRLYLPLGHERDGWNRELAERTLSVVAACRVQDRVGCASRRRRRPR